MTHKRTLKNIAVIGAGRWGKNLLRNFYQLGALHTICDTKPSLLETYQELYPCVSGTSNYKSILNNPQILRVVIAAPAAQHYNLAKKALLMGKDVYVEKPLCLNSSEGEELVALAKDKDKILMVGHLLHYHPCVHHMGKLVCNGDIGVLHHIVSNRLDFGPIRTEENALWNFAPHDISVILALCGQRLPIWVRSTGGAYVTPGVTDTSMTTLHFEKNLQAHIYVSWLNPFKEQRLVVIGSSGTIVFDDVKPWEDKLILYQHCLKGSAGGAPTIQKMDIQKLRIPQSEPLRAECEHFIQCCEKRITPRTDGQEGVRVLQVLQAAQASIHEGGTAKNPTDNHDLSVDGKMLFCSSKSH